MSQPIYLQSTILPGHRLELTSPDFPEGARVEVTVVVTAESNKTTKSIFDIVPPGLYRTAEEIDRYIQEERNSWDR